MVETFQKSPIVAGNTRLLQMHAYYRGHFMTLQNSSGSLHLEVCAQSFYEVILSFVVIYMEFHMQIQRGFGPIGLLGSFYFDKWCLLPLIILIWKV